MKQIEKLHFEKEINDIKEWCKTNNQTITYQNQNYYLYGHTIYDKDMNVFISNATNGFLDLYECFEYFEQPVG